jgi:hypothetical protein
MAVEPGIQLAHQHQQADSERQLHGPLLVVYRFVMLGGGHESPDFRSGSIMTWVGFKGEMKKQIPRVEGASCIRYRIFVIRETN